LPLEAQEIDGSAASSNIQEPDMGLAERLAALRNADISKVKPLQSTRTSTASSLAGENVSGASPSNPTMASPRADHADKEPRIEEMRAGPAEPSPVTFIAPQALHYNAEHPAIVPEFLKEPEADLTANDLELPDSAVEETANVDTQAAPVSERSPSPEIRGVDIGPFDFAIPLPMDSRIKDDYEKRLDKEADTITKFLEVSDSDALVEVEVGLSVPNVRAR
jgi:hypothetical protein